LPAWSPLSPPPTVPTARANMGVANALASNQLLVSAGDDGSNPPTNNETWSLTYSGSGAPSWTQQGLGTNPGIRSNPALAFDPVSQNAYLVGGADFNPSIPVYKNDVWKLTGTAPTPPATAWTWTWGSTPISTTGSPPPGLFGHVAAMLGSKLYVFGGQDASSNFMNDVWVLDFSAPTATWTHALSSGPIAPRAFHAAALDNANSRLIVFGGFDGVNYRNDTWALNLGSTLSWTSISTVGLLPSGRSNTSAVYFATAQMLVVFGGDSPNSTNDLWMLSLSSNPTWRQVVASGTIPEARGGHGCIFVDSLGRMILFGGIDFNTFTTLPDLWQLQF